MVNAPNTHDIPNRNVIPKTDEQLFGSVSCTGVLALGVSYYHSDHHHQHNKVEDKYCQNGDQESTKYTAKIEGLLFLLCGYLSLIV